MGPCHPHADHFCLPALALSGPCGHLGSELADESSLSFSPLLKKRRKPQEQPGDSYVAESLGLLPFQLEAEALWDLSF